MRHWLSVGAVALVMILAGVPGWAENQEGDCSENWSRWRQAFAMLKENAAGVHSTKQESITPEIERALQEKGGRLPMARIVQSVLEDQRQKIGSATEKLREASNIEEAAFSALRDCLGRREFRKASKSDPDLIERKKVEGSLRNLLLDEAYAQYSTDRGRATTSRSDSRSYGGPYGPSPFGYNPGGYYRGGRPPGYPQYR